MTIDLNVPDLRLIAECLQYVKLSTSPAHVRYEQVDDLIKRFTEAWEISEDRDEFAGRILKTEHKWNQ